jgi:hypothetical protein
MNKLLDLLSMYKLLPSYKLLQQSQEIGTTVTKTRPDQTRRRVVGHFSVSFLKKFNCYKIQIKTQYVCISNSTNSGTIRNRLLTFPEMHILIKLPIGGRSVLLNQCRQPVNFKTGNSFSIKKYHDIVLTCCTSACSITM